MVNLPFEQLVAVASCRQLLQEVGVANARRQFPKEEPPDDLLERAMDAGVEQGLAALRAQLKNETALLADVLEHDFRLRSSIQVQSR